MVTHRGGCHCKKVQFEVDAPADIQASVCNCSICNMFGYLHLIVPKSSFRLLQGETEIETYTFRTGVARHYFCRTCGVKSFYIPRSHPHGVSVNVRCLDGDTVESLQTLPFDGRNWEKNIEELRHPAMED